MIPARQGISSSMASPVFHIPGFEYVRELGVGGMATVYLAIQRSLDRKVAIKVMRRAGADENFEARFLLEGRTMAKLQHRNIVGVYDIVQNDEINYIAMEFLGGGTLSDRMRQGLSLGEAIAVVVQTAAALQFAHDHEVVHRDLKPANIMFRDDRTPVLTDFGIARAKTDTRLTQTGMMVGTPTYMSPEQAMGNDVDGRSDQYSLGVLFYEMLTGAPPFGGETPLNVVLAHINQAPPPLPAPFAQFQPILDKMLAKDREQRFADLQVFVRELKAMLTGSETLLSKLTLDPNESSSEQLRALGFSDSQISTGTRRAANRTSGQRSVQRNNTTGSGRGVLLPPDPPSRPRWLVPAAIAAVVLGAAIGLWAAFGGKSELDPALTAAANALVKQADGLIEQNKLVAPSGDNAFETLQQVLQIAPEFPAAQERLTRIAATLKQQAEQALDSKNFDAAEARIAGALVVAPEDADIVALQKRIATTKLAAATDGKVAELVQQSQAAQKAGKLYGEGRDNALAYARQAVELNPQSVAAKAQVNAITEQALTSARVALKAGKLDDAAQLLDASASYFASAQAWKQIESELVKAHGLAQQQSRIDDLLELANAHAAAGRYSEPAGNNALETLARVAELDPSNSAAAALRREIGVASVKAAQAAEKAGDSLAALERYADALRAQPDNTEYLAAKVALEKSLGERQMQLASALGKAREAIDARRYLAPTGNNAREAIEAALKVDPGNADARRLRDDLPNLVSDAAVALGEEARYDEALALLSDAIRQYPGDTRFAALSRSLEGQRDSIKRAADRQQLLGSLQSLLASGQLKVESTREVAAAVRSLLAADPADTEALRYRQRFLGQLSSAVAAAERPEQLEALRPVLAEAQKGFGASVPEVASLQTTFASASTAMQEKERARLDAISGTLVLNAYPWANVDSVIEQASNKPVTLPSERSTPLRLKLPAGTYRVTFKHPAAGKSVAVLASVQAQKSQSANGSFPTLTARDYLKRAGYAQ
jgi:serine/threonine-protein kinase PpkA